MPKASSSGKGHKFHKKKPVAQPRQISLTQRASVPDASTNKEYPQTLLSNMWQQREALGDLYLQVGEEKLKVHFSVLSGASTVFQELLENIQCGDNAAIPTFPAKDGITFAALEKAIKQIYTGRIEDLSLDNAEQYLDVAKAYKLRQLAEYVDEFLIHNHLKIPDVAKVLDLIHGRRLKNQHLQEFQRFVQSHFYRLQGNLEFINVAKAAGDDFVDLLFTRLE